MNHDVGAVRLMLLSAPSKSSTYDTLPSLLPVLLMPGMKWANSAVRVKFDGALVSMPGSKSISFVMNGTSWL